MSRFRACWWRRRGSSAGPKRIELPGLGAGAAPSTPLPLPIYFADEHISVEVASDLNVVAAIRWGAASGLICQILACFAADHMR